MKYYITAYASFEICTVVEANSEEEAISEAADREVQVCIHGSQMLDGDNDIDFILKDGTYSEINQIEVVDTE